MTEIPPQLLAWRHSHRKTAWRPQTQQRDVDVLGSKFLGMPYLSENEAWPRCGTCHSELQLFLQLNLSKLPAPFSETIGTGLLQFFYCVNDECEEDLWNPFSQGHLVRIVKPSHPPGSISIPSRFAQDKSAAIVGWEPFADYPATAEHSLLGLAYNYDFQRNVVSIEQNELDLVFPDLDIDIAEEISQAASGDKLGGWPHWVQGVEYPNCPHCNATMYHIVQIDSEDCVPYMFGDMGCGHITQCPNHHHVLAFAWACC